MRINGKHYQTVWMEGEHVCMIDQTLLPFELKVHKAATFQDCCHAIKNMIVRGAGAIGVVAGYAMALACLESERSGNENIRVLAKKSIESTRPTAGNLFYAVQKVFEAGLTSAGKAMEMAVQLALENVEEARQIGLHGNELIKSKYRIGTHCNGVCRPSIRQFCPPTRRREGAPSRRGFRSLRGKVGHSTQRLRPNVIFQGGGWALRPRSGSAGVHYE